MKAPPPTCRMLWGEVGHGMWRLHPTHPGSFHFYQYQLFLVPFMYIQ